MCSNIVIAMRFKDFQLTTSSTEINTEFKNASSVIKAMNNFIHCNKVTFKTPKLDGVSIENKMLSYRRETALQGAL